MPHARATKAVRAIVAEDRKGSGAGLVEMDGQRELVYEGRRAEGRRRESKKFSLRREFFVF